MIIEKAVNLSIIEIFLGSFLHLFRVPFSGHFLSLNQGVFLSQNAYQTQNRFTAAKANIELSMIVAIMKSLSPVGKKLGPMVSISMQGFLFSTGTLLFGTRLIGQMLSICLLSLWAFFQPLLSYFIIYGGNLVNAFIFYQEKLNVSDDQIKIVLLTLLSIKLLLGVTLVLIFNHYGDVFFKRYESFLKKAQPLKAIQKKDLSSPTIGALKDLLKPTMIISYLLMGIYFYFYNDDLRSVIIPLLRAIAIAFIFFYLVRSPLTAKFFFKVAKKNKYFLYLYNQAVKVAAEVRSQLG